MHVHSELTNVYSSTAMSAALGGTPVSRKKHLGHRVVPDNCVGQMLEHNTPTESREPVSGVVSCGKLPLLTFSARIVIVHGNNETVPAYDGDLAIQMADLYHGFSPALLNLYFTVRTRPALPLHILTTRSPGESKARLETSPSRTGARSTVSASTARPTAPSSM